MPGLIVGTEKKLTEDDPTVYDSDEGDDTEDSDDDDDDDNDEEDEAEVQSIREELAELRRELAHIQMTMADNFKQIKLMLEALPKKVLEILAQHSAGPSVSHEPGPTPASTTVDTVASKPDSISSSPAPAADAPPATIGCTPDRARAFLVPAAVVAIPPIEAGDTHMPDAAS